MFGCLHLCNHQGDVQLVGSGECGFIALLTAVLLNVFKLCHILFIKKHIGALDTFPTTTH